MTQRKGVVSSRIRLHWIALDEASQTLELYKCSTASCRGELDAGASRNSRASRDVDVEMYLKSLVVPSVTSHRISLAVNIYQTSKVMRLLMAAVAVTSRSPWAKTDLVTSAGLSPLACNQTLFIPVIAVRYPQVILKVTVTSQFPSSAQVGCFDGTILLTLHTAYDGNPSCTLSFFWGGGQHMVLQ